ncbi:hypothetical protein [Brevibacterium paucivorans]
MDGFSGFKNSLDRGTRSHRSQGPFHVVKLAGDALDEGRRRV